MWYKFCGLRARVSFSYQINGCVTEAASVASGRGREGVIIQSISRQTDSNIEPAKRSGKNGPKRGERVRERERERERAGGSSNLLSSLGFC